MISSNFRQQHEEFRGTWCEELLNSICWLQLFFQFSRTYRNLIYKLQKMAYPSQKGKIHLFIFILDIITDVPHFPPLSPLPSSPCPTPDIYSLRTVHFKDKVVIIHFKNNHKQNFLHRHLGFSGNRIFLKVVIFLNWAIKKNTFIWVYQEIS